MLENNDKTGFSDDAPEFFQEPHVPFFCYMVKYAGRKNYIKGFIVKRQIAAIKNFVMRHVPKFVFTDFETTL